MRFSVVIESPSTSKTSIVAVKGHYWSFQVELPAVAFSMLSTLLSPKMLPQRQEQIMAQSSLNFEYLKPAMNSCGDP
jgi:hypothetical protein